MYAKGLGKEDGIVIEQLLEGDFMHWVKSPTLGKQLRKWGTCHPPNGCFSQLYLEMPVGNGNPWFREYFCNCY